MTIPDEGSDRDTLQRLEARLSAAAADVVPDWTNQTEGDPGITLAQLFAFLTELLIFRANEIPERSRVRILEAVQRIESVFGGAGAGVTVCVDGQPWREVPSLREAGPDDDVYTLTNDGVVQFGDGEHGRQPADGTVSVTFHGDSGPNGNVAVSVTTPWPQAERAYRIVIDPPCSISIQHASPRAD